MPNNVTNRCFIIGGVAYGLAKNIRNDKEQFTVLLPYDKYCKNIFKKEKMQYGIEIYKAIAQSTKTQLFIFPWNGNFAIGYLLTIPY